MENSDPYLTALVCGAILGFVWAARHLIAWIIIIVGLFFALVFALDGPVRDTLNDHCDQCGDKFIWYTIEQWFPANDDITYETRRQLRQDKEES